MLQYRFMQLPGMEDTSLSFLLRYYKTTFKQIIYDVSLTRMNLQTDLYKRLFMPSLDNSINPIEHSLLLVATEAYLNYLLNIPEDKVKEELPYLLETKIIVHNNEITLNTKIEWLRRKMKYVIEKQGQKFRTVYV
ncbi:hypothetical protein A3K72_00655 [Candidatus Woesearchaeota archaeon RBG_13_36_6]|nr:MAG: hypothetical protein A3K72_00655 [Candidatus Woesearchaeota archaeon RBG_13_36_6]